MNISFSRNLDGDILVLVNGVSKVLVKECIGSELMDQAHIKLATKYYDCHNELLAIFRIGMCWAECEPTTPQDTLTIRLIKDMALEINRLYKQRESICITCLYQGNEDACRIGRLGVTGFISDCMKYKLASLT